MPSRRKLLHYTHPNTIAISLIHHGLPRRPTYPSHRSIQTPCSVQRMGIRSLAKHPRPSRFNLQHRRLESTPLAAHQRKLAADVLSLRPGALAVKKGMTSLYDPETSVRTPVTVLQLDNNQVIYHKTQRQHGYSAVQIGAGQRQPKTITRPMLGHFSAQGVPVKRHVVEFRVRDQRGLATAPVAMTIEATHFSVGQFVDARSISKGKGFQGVMKRWGMHGQDRSHGVSLSHRSLGSAGQGQGGGSRVYPGKKMAGNMGAEWRTQQCLKVMQVDGDNGIVVVKGAVSGPKGGIVQLRDAIKKPWPAILEEEGKVGAQKPVSRQMAS